MELNDLFANDRLQTFLWWLQNTQRADFWKTPELPQIECWIAAAYRLLLEAHALTCAGTGTIAYQLKHSLVRGHS